jgi:protein tyrosine phosphatase (PTP) superfamily phosphohydrolase (DUF442 family)
MDALMYCTARRLNSSHHMIKQHYPIFISLFLGLFAATSYAQAQSNAIKKIETSYLPNLVELTAKVSSGGLPEGDAAFAELKELGYQTIISVDGMTPDIATATKYGLRYIHLPHGYDGISDDRVLEIAKAINEVDGPIYIHCHHGKHRSPAAAAAACIANGSIDEADGLSVLAVAGTNPKYKGLYRSVAKAVRVDVEKLNSLQVEFKEIAAIPPLAEAMVEMEHAFDHLKQRNASDATSWNRDAIEEAGHEALLFRELYTELLRSDDLKQRPSGFVDMMRAGEATAKELEDLLNSIASEGALSATHQATIAQKLQSLAKNCTACHEAYRDNP